MLIHALVQGMWSLKLIVIRRVEVLLVMRQTKLQPLHGFLVQFNLKHMISLSCLLITKWSPMESHLLMMVQELLLVYEYIPNRTVVDHVHGKQSNIVHRDVKSNNLLLDGKFHVKAADFGLSRWFPNDVTYVSTAPQGTPGYVDPEYYQCYQLTDKSDVYSFGIVLAEFISSLQAVDITRHRNDVSLANMAVNKIQSQELHELVDPFLGYGKDNAVRRMTATVGELALDVCSNKERRDLQRTNSENKNA